MYYVDRNTRSTTWNFPSLNQVVDHHDQAHEGDTTMAGPGSLPAGWEEQHTSEGRPYYVNHKEDAYYHLGRSKTSRLLYNLRLSRNSDRCRLAGKRDVRPRRVCTTLTTTPRRQHGMTHDCHRRSMQTYLRYKRDFRQKLIYFRSQPAMRTQPGHANSMFGEIAYLKTAMWNFCGRRQSITKSDS